MCNVNFWGHLCPMDTFLVVRIFIIIVLYYSREKKERPKSSAERRKSEGSKPRKTTGMETT